MVFALSHKPISLLTPEGRGVGDALPESADSTLSAIKTILTTGFYCNQSSPERRLFYMAQKRHISEIRKRIFRLFSAC